MTGESGAVCLIHGLKFSEHICLYCCLCFKSLTPEECSTNKDGTKEDVCKKCNEEEYEYGMWKKNK